MILTLTVPGEPVPYMRVTRDRQGNAHVPKKMREEKVDIGKAFKAKYIVPEPFEGRVWLELSFYTRSMVKDYDNLAKLATDALNGVLWKDDNQIDDVHIHVIRDHGEPRTVIEAFLWGKADIIERASAT